MIYGMIYGMIYDMIYGMIYMIYQLTAIGLSPGGSSTVHICTQTIHRTQNRQHLEQHNNLGEWGSRPVLASYTLAFALQLRKNCGKTSVRVAASKNNLWIKCRFCISLICWIQSKRFAMSPPPQLLPFKLYSAHYVRVYT